MTRRRVGRDEGVTSGVHLVGDVMFDAAAWAVAEREWRGVLTLRALRTLQAYDRIDTV